MLNIVNNIIDGLKLNVEYYKSIVNDDHRLYYMEDEIQRGQFIMRSNTSLLLKNKASICMCILVKFNDSTYIPCLYTDGLFNTLTKETQEFIIQHELGHFNLHLDMLLNSKGLVRNDEIEFQADEYAMNIVGKEIAIKALEELIEAGLRLNFGLGKHRSAIKEFKRRIDNLNSK